MKRLRVLTGLALIAMMSAGVAVAEPVAFKLDPSHTDVGFSIRHFFSRVPGKFNKFEGTIQLDEKNLGASSVVATIDASSIDTNHERRDTHLRSGDFFDVEKTPTITFKSTKVTPGQNGSFQVAGDLTIRGITKPVTLDCQFLGSGDVVVEGRPNGTRAGFEAKTTVNRKDFGIVWNRTLDQGGAMLGDDVAITISVEAIKEGSMPERPAAAAKPADAGKAATDKTPTDKK
jgi:polyisoprenoid-binding protein YceI